jgi:hypothetical protein
MIIDYCFFQYFSLEIKMSNKKRINRRNFLKTTGAAALGSVLASSNSIADPNAPPKTQQPKFPQVPRRKLGKTGVDVPCLSLGGGFNLVENQIILRNAFAWGVNYWDTSNTYAGGNSELGIGKFLSDNPLTREELFIVSKAAGVETVAGVEERLAGSLKRMNTKYVDFYCGAFKLSEPAQLTDELKQWSESAKKRKLIRFFGFSTHKNMAQCLAAAAKLDWIDVIMTRYDFRLMQDDKMQAAIEACHKAGIGLIAFKTLGFRQTETEEDKKLVKHFLQRGFTVGQAKIKAVLEDKRFSSACVKMDNIALLTSNVAAVLDETKLTRADMDVLREHARQSCSGYCAGCAYICDSALPDMPYVSDVMRYLMYYNRYGERQRARKLFAQIPGRVRRKLLSTDYSSAEALCPQRMPIGRVIAEAVGKLA